MTDQELIEKVETAIFDDDFTDNIPWSLAQHLARLVTPLISRQAKEEILRKLREPSDEMCDVVRQAYTEGPELYDLSAFILDRLADYLAKE